MKTIKHYSNNNIKNNKSKTKKRYFFNPINPRKSFDVYIDKNPKDTIPIKYSSTQDVKNTITKLEKLYKSKKYSHKRIWQVAMIMKVRLNVLKNKKPEQFYLSKKYLDFLGERTKLEENNRYNSKFKF
jgi:aminopeptidase C